MDAQAIAVDDLGRIYVADIVNSNIQIFQATFAEDPAPLLINPGLNDAWYDPGTSGQGFLITVFPDIGQMFLAWFTYDPERPGEGVAAELGEPGHRWLTAQGPYADNQAVLDVWVSSGGIFDSAEPAVTQAKDGEIIIEFSGCNVGTVSYDITSVGRQGVIPIERVALDNVALCEELNKSLQAE